VTQDIFKFDDLCFEPHPQYIHDCDDCRFLMRVQKYPRQHDASQFMVDLWDRTHESYDGMCPILIRHSDAPSDYQTRAHLNGYKNEFERLLCLLQSFTFLRTHINSQSPKEIGLILKKLLDGACRWAENDGAGVELETACLRLLLPDPDDLDMIKGKWSRKKINGHLLPLDGHL